jgi:hypothetical protein
LRICYNVNALQDATFGFLKRYPDGKCVRLPDLIWLGGLHVTHSFLRRARNRRGSKLTPETGFQQFVSEQLTVERGPG